MVTITGVARPARQSGRSIASCPARSRRGSAGVGEGERQDGDSDCAGEGQAGTAGGAGAGDGRGARGGRGGDPHAARQPDRTPDTSDRHPGRGPIPTVGPFQGPHAGRRAQASTGVRYGVASATGIRLHARAADWPRCSRTWPEACARGGRGTRRGRLRAGPRRPRPGRAAPEGATGASAVRS